MKKRIAAVCAALMLAVPVQAQAMADSEVYALAEEIGGLMASARSSCRRSHGMRAGTRRMPATEAVRGLCRYRKNGTGTG